MKKISLVLFILICMIYVHSNINVHAKSDIEKPLVIIQSEKYDHDYSYDGYKIISNNVCENIPGHYFIVYENYLTKEQIIKKVIVIENKEVDNKYYTIKESKSKIYIENVIYNYLMSDNSFIIVTEETLPSNTQDEPKSNFNLEYIENDEVLFKTELMHECYGNIKSIKVIDDIIYILGTRYFLYGGTEFFIAKYTLNGERINSMYYGGNLNDEANSFEVIDNYIYVIGITNSTIGAINSKNTGTNTFVCKLDQDLKIIDVLDISNSGNDCSFGSTVIDNKIYIIKQFIDETVNFPCLELLMIDEYLNVNNLTMLGYGFNHKLIGLGSNNNELIILRYVDDDLTNTRNIIIESCDNLLNIERVLEKNISYDYIIKDSFIKDDEISILYSINEVNKILIYDYKNNYIKEILTLEDLNNIKLESNRLITTYNENNIEVIKLNSINRVFKGTNEVLNKDTNILDYEIIIDGNHVNINEDLSNINIDANNFGSYDTIYYFTSDNLEFSYYQNIIVKDNISVKNNQTYDINIVLNFNGVGTLNNESIISNYSIKTPGQYNLVVYGKDNKIIDINFSVAELSLKKEEIEINKKNTDFSPKYFIDNIKIETTDFKKVSSINIDNTVRNTPTLKHMYWPVLIPLFILISSTIYYVKGFKR